MELYLGQERLVQPSFQYWQNPFLFLAFLGFCLELEFLPNGVRKVCVKGALKISKYLYTEMKKKALLGSMSLARTWDAPLITAAIAVAPHPLPRSRTDRPLTTRGLSKIYLKNKRC